MAETFEREALTAFDIPTCPLLEIFLQTGMLALRSSACSSSSALCSRNGAGASASASGGQGQRGGSATAAAADGPGRDLPFDAWSRPGPLTSTLEECHAAIARRAQQVEDDKQKAQQRAAQQLQQKQEKQRMWASRQRSRCLTCDPAWSPYLSRIPAPQRIHSTLVCPLSGDLMDTLNPPMASPSGSVFSLEAIKQIVETAKDEMFTDPVSGEKLTLKEFQRVFVT
uniref:RING-Gid-type domain-containing protein n=1 Tax=Chromera velia CCMP2878 TaxID=1169474 RepID=A0A0G4HQ97_9ALVE|eukprot:Cvel_7933.t1-p1 / transcript=Cvel_7933.t1 / gene=Cvel_7933 / organism=Chromera_velia_CCMP2878 / gene_product=hypothetical protein / transcript_product=hypothetical protein / location=Cvel_scaffold425:84938-89822(-) / protein_length=225 / sequence_SO=supercontig / SO=protein_coding / is_pseudo=false